MPVELPSAWARLRLGNLGDWYGGGTPRKSNSAFWDGDIPWVSPKDVKVARLLDTADHISAGAIKASATRLIGKRSVLVVTRSGILANTLPISINEVPMAINQDLKAITPFEGIDAEYLAWALRAFQRQILNQCSKHGTTVHSIELPRFRNFEIPVAPRREQQRIVIKIEKLFSELDKGVESLKTARAQLKVYRQAVLKHAFEGKLTAQWREENKDKLEAAEQLFARIEQERAERIEQQFENWIAAVKQWKKQGKIGRGPKKPTHPKLISQVDSRDVSRLPVLPKGWHWAPLAWLLSAEKVPMRTGPFGTMLMKHEHRGVGVPVLGIENIHEGKFIDGNKVFVSKEKAIELSAFEVEPEDLIISRSGTVGEICSVPRGLGKALMSTNLLRVSLNQHVVLSKLFVFMFQGGGTVRNQVKEQCKGSSREFLNQSILRSVIFPICSLDEQVQLVGEIEKRLSLADQLLGCIESELLRSNPLRQTILKNAFSGKLVEQDPSDASASVLLERIKAEKASQMPRTRTRKREAASA